AMPAILCAIFALAPIFELINDRSLRTSIRRVEWRRRRADDERVDAAIVLESKLCEHGENRQLVDQIRRIENVDAGRVVRIALDEQIALEVAHVLDEAVIHVLLTLRYQLGLDDPGSDNRLPGPELGAIVGELMPREFRRDGLLLIP